MSDLPSHVRVVIIGGGCAGTSAQYHLALKGWTDTLLIEANELTAGSTWHAAGNCPNFSGNWNLMRLQQYSTGLYKHLADTVDYPITYHRTGAVRLAHTKDRMEEFHHVAGMASYLGLDFDVVTPEGLKEHFPLMETHELTGGLWDPDDGDIDPSQLTQAYAKGARDLGAKIERFCRVRDVKRSPDGEWVVTTDKGTVKAEIVINAAGYHAPVIGKMVGRDVPCVTMEHQYLVTDALPDPDIDLPMLRDPDDSYYLRKERDGLILGPYEWQATPTWLDDTPEDFSFQLFPDSLERLEWYIEKACERVPALGEVGIRKVINGPVPYTPDGNPLIGPAPGLTNFFEICAFSFGVVQSGGAGKTLAEWVVDGEPEWDLWSLDPRRYTDFATKEYVTAKAIELYQHEYAIHFPAEERPAGRPSKASPLYDVLKEKGAMFGARGGWERATWFPRAGEEGIEKLSYHHTNWFDAVAEECKLVTEAVGLLDLTGFARFKLTGKGATEWLDGQVSGRLPAPGRVGLAYFCSDRGTVVTEMTVTRFAEDDYWLIGPAAGEWHDEDWLRKNLPSDGSLSLTNETDQFGTLVIAGPKARDVLSSVTQSSLTNEAFAWLSHQEISIAGVSMVAIRVNYVGELGWELHLPIGKMITVYDALMDAGKDFGISDFGMYAMESLRLEKGYRAWKQDLSSEYSPLTTSLKRFVSMKKEAYTGRDALVAEKEQGSELVFVSMVLEELTAEALYGSIIWQGDKQIGFVTSGGYGHRIGKSIALGYVPPALAESGTKLEIDILGERKQAEIGEEPLFDPKNERLRA